MEGNERKRSDKVIAHRYLADLNNVGLDLNNGTDLTRNPLHYSMNVT